MQNINLLNDMPKVKLILPASMLVKIFTVFISILFAISFWQWSKIVLQYQNLHKIERKAQQIEQSYISLVKENPVITVNKSIFNAVNKLNLILKKEKFKFENISQHLLISGFSKYLKLFASNVPDSISLKGFSVSNIKSNIALYGEALSAKSVSMMVEQLYLSSLFDDVTFDKYVISLDERKIKFEVATSYLINKTKFLSSKLKQGKIQQQILLNSNK